VQQGEFGAREELRCLRESGGFCGVELLDEGFEFFVGHACGCVGVGVVMGGGGGVVVVVVVDGEGEVGRRFVGGVSCFMSCEGLVVFEMGVAVSGVDEAMFDCRVVEALVPVQSKSGGDLR
jgi:hypothetical protein